MYKILRVLGSTDLNARAFTSFTSQTEAKQQSRSRNSRNGTFFPLWCAFISLQCGMRGSHSLLSRRVHILILIAALSHFEKISQITLPNNWNLHLSRTPL